MGRHKRIAYIISLHYWKCILWVYCLITSASNEKYMIQIQLFSICNTKRLILPRSRNDKQINHLQPFMIWSLCWHQFFFFVFLHFKSTFPFIFIRFLPNLNSGLNIIYQFTSCKFLYKILPIHTWLKSPERQHNK